MKASLSDYLTEFARDERDIAYVYARGLRTHRMSYAQLARLAWQCAHWLRSEGNAGPGSRVVLWGQNSGEWAALFWGCVAAGVVAVPVDEQASTDYVNKILADTQACLLFHGDAQRTEGLDAVRRQRLAELAELVAGKPCSAPEMEGLSRETLAQIIYTSGSTAMPKGVCLTHGNTLASLEPMETEIAKYLRWERPFHPVRFLVQLPLSHVFGQMLGLFVPVLLRGEMHFVADLSPADVIETIRKRRISVAATVPRYLEVLGAEIRRGSERRWSSARFAERFEKSRAAHFLRRWWLFRDVHRRLGWKFWAFVCGGASLPEETESLWHRLGYAVIQGYGMTETASLISVNHPFKMSRGSIGKSMPGREIKIGEGGEILVRGQTVSPGYWRKEGGVRPLSEQQEWFSTGDLAALDDAGNLFFRGRSKEMIVAANGMNIVPEDVETALRHEAEIRDAVVVGVEGPAGPEAFALLLASPGAGLKAAVERANTHLETHQRVARWAAWPEPDFPRTSTRKVRRGAVRDFAQAVVNGRSVEELRAGVLEWLLAESGGRWEGPLRETDRLAADLGLDSLGRVQLLSALEAQFELQLDESVLTETTTVGEVRKMLSGGEVALPSPEIDGALETASQPSTPASKAKRKGKGERPYPFANWPSFWWVSAIRQAFNVLALRPLTRLYSARAQVVGAEHLHALRGPALFVSNHLTEVDGALIVGRFPWRIARRMAIAMSGEMLRGYKYPAADERWYWKLWLPLQYVLVVAAYHVFPLPRTSGFRRAFRHAGMLVDKGYHLLVFPEGQRSFTGELLPFQQGIGILARELRIPVVPLRLHGVHELREEGRSVARKGEVTIHVGEPIRFRAEDEPAEIARTLQEAVGLLQVKSTR